MSWRATGRGGQNLSEPFAPYSSAAASIQRHSSKSSLLQQMLTVSATWHMLLQGQLPQVATSPHPRLTKGVQAGLRMQPHVPKIHQLQQSCINIGFLGSTPRAWVLLHVKRRDATPWMQTAGSPKSMQACLSKADKRTHMWLIGCGQPA